MSPKNILKTLVAVNALAFLYGIYYYRNQLAQTSPFLWVFVIDCPLYALLLAAVFSLSVSKNYPKWFTFVSSMGAFKYGAWTVFAIIFYSNYFLAPANQLVYLPLFAAHIGLFLEGLWLVGAVEAAKKLLAGALAWFLFNDYVDYWLGAHPWLPESPEKLAVTAGVTIALSLASVAFFYLASKKRLNALGFVKPLEEARNIISSWKGA